MHHSSGLAYSGVKPRLCVAVPSSCRPCAGARPDALPPPFGWSALVCRWALGGGEMAGENEEGEPRLEGCFSALRVRSFQTGKSTPLDNTYFTKQFHSAYRSFNSFHAKSRSATWMSGMTSWCSVPVLHCRYLVVVRGGMRPKCAHVDCLYPT